jgi:hypothetical protein
VSLPTANPFVVVGATLKVALPLLREAEPAVTLPTLNVTVPVGVPLAAVTVAVKLCVAEELPRAMEERLAATDVVVLAVTIRVAALLVEPESLLSPAYTAVIESEPTAKPLDVVAAMVSDAVPPESVAVPSEALPFLNVTVPVATEGLTVAVNVTEAPYAAEFGDTEAEVVVESREMVSVAALLVEPESLVSPAYTAVIESEPTAKPLAVVAAKVSDAEPLESVAVPSEVLPFLNVTEPVAVAGLTVAVNVTEAPRVTELGDTEAEVVVESREMVSVAALLVEPESLLSPPYTAVIESEPTAKPLAVVAAKVSDAEPLESVALPSVVLPFLNVTEPVAVDGLTVAVNVTEAP